MLGFVSHVRTTWGTICCSELRKVKLYVLWGPIYKVIS